MSKNGDEQLRFNFEDENNLTPDESALEFKRGSEKISYGTSIDLAKRALYLDMALGEGYLKLSKLLGLDYASGLDSSYGEDIRNRFSEEKLNSIRRSQPKHNDSGDRYFHIGFGAQEMKKADVDPKEIKRMELSESDKFINELTGPKNRNRRNRLRRLWTKIALNSMDESV
jgi:hypothetical protein